jgi:glycine cleavage system regulatory protein
MISVSTLDRVGALTRVSGLLAEAEANIVSTYAATLGQTFVCHVLFDAHAPHMKQIQDRYAEALADLSPSFQFVELGESKLLEFVVHIWAQDRPGIINEVAATLALHKGDIVASTGRVYLAEDTGAPIFAMDMRVGVPSGRDMEEVRKAIRALSGENGWAHEFEIIPVAARSTARSSKGNGRGPLPG